MIYLILLAILAVLLFGSAFVIGVLGIVLGAIAGLAALITATVFYGVQIEVVVTGVIVVVAMIGAANLFLNRKITADPDTKSPPKPTSAAYRDAYASMEFRERVKND